MSLAGVPPSGRAEVGSLPKEVHNSKNSKCDIFAVAHLCEHRLYYVTVSGEQSPPEDPVSRYLEIP